MTGLVLVALAATADWSTTFPPTQTASYLGRENAVVAVVGAGPGAQARADAEAALVAALQASGKVQQVLTGEGLTLGPTDEDVAVVKAAATLNADRVVVVRAVAGATDKVQVALYDKGGSTLAVLTCTLGVPVRGRAPPANAGLLKLPPKGRELYEREHVTPGYGVALNPSTGQLAGPWRSPQYHGNSLEGARFYKVLGEPELEAQYKSRLLVKVLLISIGVFEAVASSLIGSLINKDAACAVYDAAILQCLKTVAPDLTVPGLLVGSLGAIAAGIGIFYRVDPVTDERRLELIKTYNQRLEEKAGRVSSAHEQEAPSRGVTVRLGVSLVPGGAGGSLALEF
jgi:hypothetical protein